ncbi:MAG: winged helix-turn-helix domain-containing protein [Nitrososphaerales archaeon]
MSTLFKKDVNISHVITTSVERSRALDEARATILNLLSHKVLSTESIARELKKAGYNKATTTVRHHLDILKDCGLIEVVRIQEVRGAVLKYYAATAKFLGFENTFDSSKYGKAISETSMKLLKIVSSIVDRYHTTISNANSLVCPYCSMQHGKEYIIIEIINRAIAEMVQSKEFIRMIKELDDKKKVKK